MTVPSIVIQPQARGHSLVAEGRELWRYRRLVRTLLERDLRVRYKNSALGIAWTVINPLIQVLVLTIAVGYILSSGPSNLSSYIFCAYLPWTFFQTSVLDASTSVLVKLPLLKKVYFPREIPVIAAIGQNFFQFLVTMLVFVLYRWGLVTLFYGWPGWPPVQILWLPVVVLILFLLTLGVSFFVCAWNVFYEDVKFLLTAAMSFLFYLLPIVYFAENIVYSSRIPPSLRSPLYHLYLLNPLAWVITAFKQMFFQVAAIANRGAHQANIPTSAPFDWRYMLIALATSSLICVSGYGYFNRRKWKFSERP
ncbi:MAG: ABC transporter permease [Armatimonadetes bacterium]|nr:ABC transporter permease [Armatimonadota bacterium]